MIYHILNQGKLVKIVKTFPEVARYMKAHHPTKRGFSAKTLRKFDFTENIGLNGIEGVSDYTKGDIIIRQVDEIADRKVVRQLKKNYISTANSHIIKYRKEINISKDEVSVLAKKIMDKIQSIVNVDNKVFDVIIEDESSFQTVSTGYKGYNQVFQDLLEKLYEHFSRYESYFQISRIIINEMTVPPAEEQIIYKKTNNKRVDMVTKDDTQDVIFDIEYRMSYLDINGSEKHKNKYLKLFKKYRIINPNTYKNCLYYSAFMGIHNTMDKNKINNTIDDFRKIYKNNLNRNLGDLKLILNKNPDYRFVVYFLGHNKIQKIKIGEKLEETKTIKLMVKGNHCYLMNKTDIKFEYDKEPNKQLIDAPKKEQDIDYKNIQIMTYDMETCNEEEDIKDITNIKTMAYAVGYSDGKNTVTIFKENKKQDVMMDFIKMIELINKNTVFYGHNAGKFDLILLMRYIMKNKKLSVITFLESNGRIINLQLKNVKTNCNIFFRDSYNFICMSLKDACDSFKNKTKKLDGDVEHDLINCNNCYIGGDKINDLNIKEYVEKYLINDCLSLHEILTMFNDIIFNAYGFTIMEVLTNAGIARRVFLEKYYKNDLYYLSDKVDMELRKYYFGGRNECLNKLGETTGKLFYVDFTSLYPYVMHKYNYPTGKITIIDEHSDSKPILENLDNYFGFIECKFRHVNKNSRPLHAVVNNFKLTFSHFDNWETSILSSEEIKYSINNNLGYEYEFIKVYNYDTNDCIYKDMVNDLFKMKCDAENNGNEALRQIAKIIVNSSYGFFGINYNDREQSKIEKIYKDEERYEALEHQVLGMINDQMLKAVNFKESDGHALLRFTGKIKPNCANVGLASMICSNARMELYKLMRAIDLKGGDIFYCDTDSIITNYNIYNDIDFKEPFIRTDTALLGELTNECKGDIKKLLKKDGYDSKQINEILKDYTRENAMCFNKLITCANKFYFLNAEYKINGKIYKKQIMKMKGVNSKQTFKNRTVNHDTKEISYTDMHKDGKYKCCEEDYNLITQGYTLSADTMGFKTNFQSAFMKEKGLLKTHNKKEVKQLYTKADLDSDNNIKPFSL
jgi:hypothetical protein